jgi:predicted ArsR family transcriptional regulator
MQPDRPEGKPWACDGGEAGERLLRVLAEADGQRVSVPEIARRLGRAPTPVKQVMRRLRERGRIVVERALDERGTPLLNMYRVIGEGQRQEGTRG